MLPSFVCRGSLLVAGVLHCTGIRDWRIEGVDPAVVSRAALLGVSSERSKSTNTVWYQ